MGCVLSRASVGRSGRGRPFHSLGATCGQRHREPGDCGSALQREQAGLPRRRRTRRALDATVRRYGSSAQEQLASIVRRAGFDRHPKQTLNAAPPATPQSGPSRVACPARRRLPRPYVAFVQRPAARQHWEPRLRISRRPNRPVARQPERQSLRSSVQPRHSAIDPVRP
jgi:hypothetical protein